MMIRLNYVINLLNIFLLFIYFIFININLTNIKFEYLITSLIIINLIVKLYIWYNFNISKKKDLDIIINNIFFSNRFTKVSIFIFSIATPIYMIFQKESLIIDLFIEKLSFLLVFIFALIGFYLEFFILESKSKK
tara:strand:- start:276 stop:680 length:405 start_codon:yes stop_codon:yes gene_type:complete